jgi:hypothetical protein
MTAAQQKAYAIEQVRGRYNGGVPPMSGPQTDADTGVVYTAV